MHEQDEVETSCSLQFLSERHTKKMSGHMIAILEHQVIATVTSVKMAPYYQIILHDKISLLVNHFNFHHLP